MNGDRPTRWHDLRTMLTDWIAWLDETQQWAEATAAARVGDRDPLAPSSDAPTAETAEPMSETMVEPLSSVAETSRPDLFALLGAMTALRQEVTLQTRSARRDREQSAQTLEQLSSVVTELEGERQETDARRAAREADVVPVDALLELHDALSRAERQARHLTASTVMTLNDWSDWHDLQEPGELEPQESADHQTDNTYPENGTSAVEPEGRSFGRIRRWFGRSAAPPLEVKVPQEPAVVLAPVADSGEPSHAQLLCQIGVEAARMADRLDGLVTGYGLSLQRLERHLLTCGIEPISCLGQPVDPELMEVVQIVVDNTQPPGTVIDEVRRGYWRHGQVYRFSQVVANRAENATPAEQMTEDAPDAPPQIDC